MDIKPMTKELHHVWITGDRKFFLNKKEAEVHQELYEASCREKSKEEK